MTTDQFLRLSDDHTAQFSVHRVTVDSRIVNVNIERCLIPADADPAAVIQWATQNAREAIGQMDDGNERYGSTLGTGWKWVYRIAHNGGGVSILNAGA